MKKLFCLLLAALLMLSAAACGRNENRGSTLIYGSNDYTRINPALDEHGEINILIFDGLTAHGKNNAIEARLAERWEINDTATVYTFHLRRDVKWHDGEAFTAQDVKFTYEAIMDPENGSENASNYEDVTSITIPDDYTVTFTLSAPNYAFLDYMTMSILPEHILAGKDLQTDEFFRSPIGTGPYKLEKWDAGQAITLRKNDDYFLGAANIETIVFKIVPDDSAKALQLKSGELDLALLTPKDAATFAGIEGYTTYHMQTSDYRGILYNFRNEFWQKNADLIPAISYAIDRQAMVDSVLLGQGEVAYSPIQRNEYNYESTERYDYDPAKAEQLLVNAGCVKGEDGFYCRDGERIRFTINASAGDQVRIDMALIAAQQLRAIGLDVNAAVPESMDWGGQECCIIGWGSPFDADDHTYKVFGTDKGANYSGYSNLLVDRYLTEARQTGDSAKRAEAYKNFQIELAKAPAYTFFCYLDAMYVGNSGIQGIDRATVLGHHGVGIFWNVRSWTLG